MNQHQPSQAAPEKSCGIEVSLLTGGSDKPYVLGLVASMVSSGVALDLIGSDELDCPELRGPGITQFNLRGDQNPNAGIATKVSRILRYYVRLIAYAAAAKPKIFHILWNNKFEYFDRTVLMLYYKLLRKRIVFTVHNVNAGRRDLNDTRLNRWTLRIQYRLCDRILVHTEKMKSELVEEFGVQAARVSVIPFGVNHAVPHTALTSVEAKHQLGIRPNEKTVLFFGIITPYKGVEYLTAAFKKVSARCHGYRLILAGKPNKCEEYWRKIREEIEPEVQSGQILLRAEFVPDHEAEVYFKAADVFVLPYTHIYQSGVLVSGQSFGLPVLVADVGSLREEIAEGETGFSFKPADVDDLARAMEQYFASDLYKDLENRRDAVRNYSRDRHSWEEVARITNNIYSGLVKPSPAEDRENPNTSNATFKAKA